MSQKTCSHKTRKKAINCIKINKQLSKFDEKKTYESFVGVNRKGTLISLFVY